MQGRSFSFTKEAISKISLPVKGRVIYKDTKEQGLILIVSYTGKKTFYIAKNIKSDSGKDYYRKKIGNFSDISISAARAKVSELKTQITNGFNPFKPIKEEPIGITFKELVNKYINDYAKHNIKKWKDCQITMDKKARDLYPMKIANIQRSDIQKNFNEIMEKGKYAANRFLEAVRAIFNKAIEWELLDKNPANGIIKNREKKRERYLTSKEMPLFLKALAEEQNPLLEDLFMISLLTGARKSNVLAMSWKNVNFEDEVWYISASEAKNGKSQLIHLVPGAIEILKRRKKDTDGQTDWVFPSNNGSKSGHFESPKRIWKKVLKRANLDDLRIHDLRRTHGSWMRRAGANREIIGEALNHKDLKSTEVYDIIESDQVKEFRVKAMENLMLLKQTPTSLLTDTSEDSDNAEVLKKKIKELECELKYFRTLKIL